MNSDKSGLVVGSAGFTRDYNRKAHHFGHVQSKERTIIILLW